VALAGHIAGEHKERSARGPSSSSISCRKLPEHEVQQVRLLLLFVGEGARRARRLLSLAKKSLGAVWGIRDLAEAVGSS
jgi:hypothetical protein